MHRLFLDQNVRVEVAWGLREASAVETARRQKAPLVTGDRELLDLSRRVRIEPFWVGRKQPRRAEGRVNKSVQREADCTQVFKVR